jgi:hypothetical protein
MHLDGSFARWVAAAVETQGGVDAVLFVLLPSMSDSFEQGYDAVKQVLLPHGRVLDLRDLPGYSSVPSGYCAWGHYRPQIINAIGKAVASSIESR